MVLQLWGTASICGGTAVSKLADFAGRLSVAVVLMTRCVGSSFSQTCKQHRRQRDLDSLTVASCVVSAEQKLGSFSVTRPAATSTAHKTFF